MTLMDLQRPDTCCVINGGVLITLDRFVVFTFECQKLGIELDLVAGDLLLISDGMDFAKPGPPRKAV